MYDLKIQFIFCEISLSHTHTLHVAYQADVSCNASVFCRYKQLAYMYMYMYMYIYVYVYVYIHIYVYMYMYISTCIW